MQRLFNALFSPWHSINAILLAWAGVAMFAADAFGIFQPDYRRVVAIAIIVYWVTVISELSRSRRRRGGLR